jgi:hypothetical protein
MTHQELKVTANVLGSAICHGVGNGVRSLRDFDLTSEGEDEVAGLERFYIDTNAALAAQFPGKRAAFLNLPFDNFPSPGLADDAHDLSGALSEFVQVRSEGTFLIETDRAQSHNGGASTHYFQLNVTCEAMDELIGLREFFRDTNVLLDSRFPGKQLVFIRLPFWHFEAVRLDGPSCANENETLIDHCATISEKGVYLSDTGSPPGRRISPDHILKWGDMEEKYDVLRQLIRAAETEAAVEGAVGGDDVKAALKRTAAAGACL